MFLLQRHIIYHPQKGMGKPESYGFIAAKQVEILTKDGERLIGWYAAPTTKSETIVYFHGNAGNLGDRAYKLNAFSEAGYGVFSVSWRGYGNSTGSPTEAGLMEDARAAITWLKLPPENLILYGESLGSGVALRMATEFDARLVMLEAAYISVQKRGQELYPWLPVKYLLRDNFDSLHFIDKIHAPLVMIHGDKDAIIPVAHGKTLFQKAVQSKKIYIYDGVGHTDFSMEQILVPLATSLSEMPLMEKRKSF
jgi:fermentation-respiration switch protein FrsA (DUF1100 family)